MFRVITLAFTALLAVTGATASFQARAENAPRVAASIAPLHSLAAMVMAGAGSPDLILPAGSSPHTYALRPSDMRALSRADVVLLIHPDLEQALRGPLDLLGGSTRIVVAADMPDVRLLAPRDGENWAAGHDDHGHGGGHGHGHGHDHAEDHAHHHHAHDHAHHEHDADNAIDTHIWLDPRNAAAIVAGIASVLSEIDPDRAGLYRGNAERAAAEIAELEAGISARLAPVAGRPFIVLHDAWQYLEERFGLTVAGAVMLRTDVPPGARHLSELRATLTARGVVCALAEPQFTPRLLDSLTEGTGIRIGRADPLGVGLEPGAGLYGAMMRGNATSLAACLDASAG